MKIVLATANARYIHASLALRYLLANSGEFRPNCQLLEFTLEDQAVNIAEKILIENPQLIALSIYIWNVELLTEVVSIIKTIAREIPIIIGGPEVSYEHDRQEICRLANYVAIGAGEFIWLDLLQKFTKGDLPKKKLLAAPPDALKRLAEIKFPYDEYSPQDLEHRIVYLEASRGCPFKCEFCLSSLDISAFNFPPQLFLTELEKLWQRGLRRFKFVDRTFNLHPQVSIQILDFFLDKWRTSSEQQFFTHFEMIPDHLPESLKSRLSQFPPGSLQLEIGIQSWQDDVQENISRKQNNQKSIENLLWLINNTQAHLHCDLIIGLPGETWNSFALGFSQLWRLQVAEIQVGILKRLRGTPIIRHDQQYQMRYAVKAPYSLLANDQFSFLQMQALKRFARFWDMIANSGRFKQTLNLLLAGENENAPFYNFLALSDYLYSNYHRTNKYSVESLFDGIFAFTQTQDNLDIEQIKKALISDYQSSGARGNPKILQNHVPNKTSTIKQITPKQSTPKRQNQHTKNSN